MKKFCKSVYFFSFLMKRVHSPLKSSLSHPKIYPNAGWFYRFVVILTYYNVFSLATTFAPDKIVSDVIFTRGWRHPAIPLQPHLNTSRTCIYGMYTHTNNTECSCAISNSRIHVCNLKNSPPQFKLGKNSKSRQNEWNTESDLIQLPIWIHNVLIQMFDNYFWILIIMIKNLNLKNKHIYFHQKIERISNFITLNYWLNSRQPWSCMRS